MRRYNKFLDCSNDLSSFSFLLVVSANILHSVGSLLSLWEKSRAATDGLSAMVRAAPRAFASHLFILLAEDREVDVSFRMRLEVDKQAVGVAHRLVHVVIERGIVEEQTQ